MKKSTKATLELVTEILSKKADILQVHRDRIGESLTRSYVRGKIAGLEHAIDAIQEIIKAG